DGGWPAPAGAALLVRERRFLQPRQHKCAIGACSQPLQLRHERAEVAPAALVGVAVSLDESLRPRELDGKLVARGGELLDSRQPGFDADILLAEAPGAAPPAPQPRERVQQQKAAHRAGVDL